MTDECLFARPEDQGPASTTENRRPATRKSDINVGTYSKERRVKGSTIQKADIIVHQRNGERLVLVEAKAIGVELDAYKRVKECCDKARDWGANADLSSTVNPKNPKLGKVKVVAVVAGFLTTTNVATLQASGVDVVWEHDIESISKVLS